MNNLAAASKNIDTDEAAAQGLPHALPAWVYNHPLLTRLELERVLRPSWQVVCHVNSIPRAGDYETFDLGPDSVLALRDRDGSIKAFHNVCRHRGARLLDGAGNCPGPITCPYHGWSYRHDGGLVGIPTRDSFPGLDRAQYGLRPVRVDVAFGFVFVCLAGDPPPVATVWGALGEELAPYRCEDMSIGRSRWTTISSPITCRSGIRDSTACLRRTTRIRPRCRASRGA
jgi:phenylpropionate dioxygenase-like ring-hydroxylating dioxygenase large terminal subunit